MFRATRALRLFGGNKTRDVITLYHQASNPASVRVLNMLKITSAHAAETATDDQASDHSHQNKMERAEFDLEVVEDEPTKDQSKTITEYLQATPHSGKATFQKPVVVDWTRGRAISGDNESEIIKMLNMKEQE